MSLLAAAGIPSSHDRHDTAEQSALDWRVVRRVLTYTGPYSAKRNAILVLTCVRAIQKPALAWALGAIINGPISNGNFAGAIQGTAGFLVLALFTELTFHFRQRHALELGEAVVHDLRNAVFQQLQRMPMSYFNKTKLGSILSRVITDIEAVRRGVQQVFFFSVLLFGQMLGAAVVMLYYNWVLFLVLLALGPFVWVTNRYFHPRLSRHSRAVAESQSRLTGTLAESVKGMRVIQGYTRQEKNDERYGQLVGTNAENNMELARESSLYLPLLDLNSQIFLAAMLVVGGYGVLNDFAGMTLGSLVAFFFLPALFFQSLQHLGTLYTQAIVSMAGAERVFRMLDLQPEWKDADDAQELRDPRRGQVPEAGSQVTSNKGQVPRDSGDGPRAGKQDASSGVAGGAAPGARIVPADPCHLNLDTCDFPPAAGDTAARVEFHHVSFAYDPGRLVLHDISFVAEPGQTIALVGHTGSGKTSIINLVAKFYLPSSGELLIDGQEIRTLRSDSLQSQLGLVLQTNFLFSGTVWDNIRIGRPDASDDEIRAAAQALDCWDLLDNLPNGLSTAVGERGTSLSLGQRQLICFTRALLADPRILILDEATSSVDTITEGRLQSALERLRQGRTCFIVAHRLSTIRHADLVLVLDHGRIVERGTHRELLPMRGVYWQLYKQVSDLGQL